MEIDDKSDRAIHSALHYNDTDTTNELGEPEPKGWYFWTETWADRIGPFDTREQADHMMARYVAEVLSGLEPDHVLKECKWCGGVGVHTNDCK